MELRLIDVSVAHGSTVAVATATLTVDSGTTTCVLGPNGAGKSSLVGAIGGWYTPRFGRVLLDRADLAGLPTHVRSRLGIGIVPETSTVFPLMTVDEVLRVASRRRRNDRWPVAALYELFPRLDERRRIRSGDLSGGERQMLAIARSLAAGPEVLVLDEPSAGLAPVIVGELARVLRDLANEGLGICLFEQTVLLAERLTRTAVAMNGGRLGGTVDVAGSTPSLRETYFAAAARPGASQREINEEMSPR